MDRGQVVCGELLLDEHTVHGGRCAEGGDVILGKHGQDLLCVKPIEIIHEHGALAQPLAVELAPQSLAPAGFRDGEVQSVALHQMPVLGGDVVTQRVLVSVHGHFGVARGAGGKEHQHRIVTAGCIVRAHIAAAEQAVLLIEIMPALTAPTHQHLGQADTRLGLCQLDLMGRVTVGSTQHSADTGGIEPVGEVVLHQLVGCGNGNGAQLVQT